MFDYKTAVGIAKFLVVCGRILIVISIIITLVLFVYTYDVGLLGFFLPVPIAGIVSGVFLIIFGQRSLAVIDNTLSSKEMFDVMKNGYSINTSTETNTNKSIKNRLS